MMKEKDSVICQLYLKIEDLETKLAASEIAKSTLETLSNDIERDLKKEIHEVNQVNAKLEQDLANEKEINQKLQHEIDDLKEDKRFEMSKKGKMLCMYFVQQKICRMHNSNSCPFAHSIAEVKAANSKIGGGTLYKSAPCKVCNY